MIKACAQSSGAATSEERRRRELATEISPDSLKRSSAFEHMHALWVGILSKISTLDRTMMPMRAPDAPTPIDCGKQMAENKDENTPEAKYMIRN